MIITIIIISAIVIIVIICIFSVKTGITIIWIMERRKEWVIADAFVVMVSPPVDAFFLCWMVVTLLCCDQVYATLFTLEAFMQLVSGGCRAYIWGPSWAWNWLDIFVVSSSWVELVVDLISTGESTSRSNSSFRLMRRGWAGVMKWLRQKWGRVTAFICDQDFCTHFLMAQFKNWASCNLVFNFFKVMPKNEWIPCMEALS